MTVEIKKIRKAVEYQWEGNGFGGSSRAALYGIFEDGKQIGQIERTAGGGYMESTEWTAYIFVGRKFKTIAVTRTLKEAKDRVIAKLTGDAK